MWAGGGRRGGVLGNLILKNESNKRRVIPADNKMSVFLYICIEPCFSTRKKKKAK